MSTFAESIPSIGESFGELDVALSHELIALLSDQLYQSPTKAIEELVVNSYDAEATECRLYVPASSDPDDKFIVVYDNGNGMDYDGLVNLWHIGSSKKRDVSEVIKYKRKQIGRFGIGKLATYTVSNRLTYISKKGASILTVSLDFRKFSGNPTGINKPLKLDVRKIDNWSIFSSEQHIIKVCEKAAIDFERLSKNQSWTIAILEDLKPKAEKLGLGRLKWVLETAMPLGSHFRLFLNAKEIESSKLAYKLIDSFEIQEIPAKRLEALNKNTGQIWTVKDNSLSCNLFPSGISGKVIITEQSLLGKSDDLCRSHGFFIRVRDRLISEDQPAFGIEATSYQTFYRFRSDIKADDLDDVITAPREGIEDSPLKVVFKSLLETIFNEARTRYQASLDKLQDKAKGVIEHERCYVDHRLVEHPIADILADKTFPPGGSEADGGWFYLKYDGSIDIQSLVGKLYANDMPRARYRYESEKFGRTSRVVRFDPTTSIFSINDDHELARSYSDGLARKLLEDIVTAEVLLEVYLRECHVKPQIIGELLEKRDLLLRSFANDHPYSLSGISGSLRDSAADERNLEIALIAAARALGFVATHISGPGEPDGVAVFTDYSQKSRKIIIEAKSSTSVPSLAAIDFAGLREHATNHEADGCLLVAPAYPGTSREDDSAAARRAVELRISCWTIDQLARVVEAAESRQITTRQILDIVLKSFSPDQVTVAIDTLLMDPSWEICELYHAIMTALKDLEERLPDANRTVDLIAAEVSRMPSFRGIRKEQITLAISQLALASKGGMTLSDEMILLHLSHDEILRRLSGLTNSAGPARRKGTFKDS